MARSLIHFQLTEEQSPPGYPDARAVTTPEARSLSEWYLIRRVLKVSESNLRALLQMPNAPQLSSVERTVAEALFRDAIIQLIGCFGEDKNHKLEKKSVYSSHPGGLTSINYLQDLRDSFLAHNFGPQRQSFIFVNPSAYGTDEWCAHFDVVFSLPAHEGLPPYLTVVEIALQATEALIHRLNQIVLGQLEKLGPAGVAALPPLKVRTPSMGEVRMSRRGFREGTKPRNAKGR